VEAHRSDRIDLRLLEAYGAMDALVTDAHIRWSVAGMRALGRAGLRVGALASHRRGAGLYSRYAAVRAVGPDSVADGAGFARKVARLARERGPLVVYPGHEEAIDVLFEAPLPPEALLPYAGPGPTQRLRDKRALAKAAERVGLGAPETLAEGTAAALRASPPPTPCVVKSVRPGGALERTLVVHSPAELDEGLAALPTSEALLVQELVDGPLTGLALVVSRDGAVAARFQQVALRTWPSDAGGSTLAVSVAPDEALVDRSREMLAGFGYWGLAQLQFMRTTRGPALIDVNTRFYGSLPLALAAGVNLPAAWHAVTVGSPAPRPGPYRVGVTYRWLEAEAAAAFRGSWKVLLERVPRPRAGAVWAADDPLPSVILALDSIAAKVGRRIPGRRGA
jgi:predicted ATP-grasp superfamily ATP-dependent carboligase